MFNRAQYGQHTGEITAGVTPSSAKDAFAILPQNPEVVISICAEQTGGIQLPHSTLKRGTACGPRED